MLQKAKEAGAPQPVGNTLEHLAGEWFLLPKQEEDCTQRKAVSMKLTSTAFEQNQPIPVRYTCDGVNHNPPLTFSQVPQEAHSLVLVVEDPDAPRKVFTHWLVYNLPPSTQQIREHEVPPQSKQGMTDFGTRGYGGPCPPSGTPVRLSALCHGYNVSLTGRHEKRGGAGKNEGTRDCEG